MHNYDSNFLYQIKQIFNSSDINEQTEKQNSCTLYNHINIQPVSDQVDWKQLIYSLKNKPMESLMEHSLIA